MNKKIIIFPIVFLLSILLISFISAADWDNSIGYENEDMTAVIRNFFGIGRELGKVTLTSHTTPTEIKNIIRGKDRAVMYYEFSNWELYKNGLGKVIFTDMRTGEIIDKDYYFAEAIYETVSVNDYENICTEKYNNFNNTYEDICERIIVGTHNEVKFVRWEKLENNDISNEKITIALITDVNPQDYVDGVWTIAGKRIKKHAEWTESLNVDIIGYWNFDENAGTLVEDKTGNMDWGGNNLTVTGTNWDAPGKLGAANYYPQADESYTTNINLLAFTTATVNFWVYRVAGDTFVVHFGNGAQDSNGDWIIYHHTSLGDGFMGIGFLGGNCKAYVPLNDWAMFTAVLTADNATCFSNGTAQQTTAHDFSGGFVGDIDFRFFAGSGGAQQLIEYKVDEFGFWTRPLSQAEVTQLYNEGVGITYTSTPQPSILVTLNSPENNSFHSTNPLSFNASYSYEILNITNATYYIYDSSGVFNKTTVTLTGAANSSVLNISNFVMGNYEWNVYACGINTTGTFCSWGEEGNYSFEWRPFEIDSQTYNGEVYETSRQTFELNITTLPSVLSVSSRLVYNGTSHSASTSCVAGECTINKAIDIPLVNTGKSQNKTFFFNLTLYDGTNSYNFDTSSTIGSQNVSRIYFEVCNATHPTKTINFTAYDERNLTKVSDFEMGATFFTWLGQGTIKRNQSFDRSPINEIAFCLFPNKTHYTDAALEYDTYKVNSTTYVKRNYYFQNHTITNISQSIFLYLLTAEDSTSFIQVVQDQKLSPVAGALILTQRYYPEDNTYRTVQVSKTDDNGESIGFYEAEIAEYKHLITLRGLTLLETALQKVVGKSVPYTLTFTIGESLTIPWSPWEEDPNILTSLTYNDTSKLVTFSYIDSTEETNFGNLLVLQEFPNNNTITTICNTSSVMSSATLTCNMTDYEGTFISKGIIGADRSIVDILQFVISIARTILGNTGLVIGFFIILTAGFAFIWNPVAGIVGINAAMWFVSMIGFITFPPIFLFAILGVSIITIILLKT